jgi:protein-L-isoaspartate(D-aspartate) O-methyltransferase
VRGEGDTQGPPRLTPGDDPRFLYHNVAVAIDPARMLFNGAPGLVSSVIDALGLGAGQGVLHIGAGAGYYTALIAHVVGPPQHRNGDLSIDRWTGKTLEQRGRIAVRSG